MIYVLFGPPGVGKTYIGNLLQEYWQIKFYDADDSILEEEEKAIKAGKYDQVMRNIFVDRLKNIVEKLRSEHSDIIVAEAFTKEFNRLGFFNYFYPDITFIRVVSPFQLVNQRVMERLKENTHAINLTAFNYFWKIFDEPRVEHAVIANNREFDISQFDRLFPSQKRNEFKPSGLGR